MSLLFVTEFEMEAQLEIQFSYWPPIQSSLTRIICFLWASKLGVRGGVGEMGNRNSAGNLPLEMLEGYHILFSLCGWQLECFKGVLIQKDTAKPSFAVLFPKPSGWTWWCTAVLALLGSGRQADELRSSSATKQL